MSNGELSNGVKYFSVSVSLGNLNYTDSANYSCNATNDLAQVQTRTSDPSQYTVHFPPSVVVGPTNVTVNETDSIVFECRVFAIPRASINWLNTTSNQFIEGDTDITVTEREVPHPSGVPVVISSLTISSVVKEHEGTYTCIAVNNVDNLIGTIENGTASLTVQVPPTVLASTPQVLSLVGSSQTLQFTITEASPPVLPQDITLTFTNSSDTSEDISHTANITGTSVVLTITGVQEEDQGQYTVVASNPAGSDSATVNIEVEAIPVFDVKPRDQRALRREATIFSCNGTSEPAYSIRWEKRTMTENLTIAQYLSVDDRNESVTRFNMNGLNRSPLERGVNHTNSTKYSLQGSGSQFGQLTIFDTELTDSSYYTCIIGNVHGTIEATASLTVQVIPVFLDQNSNVVVNAIVGDTVVINCITEGLPLPSIAWYRNGNEIRDSDNVVIKTENNTEQRTVFSTLNITQVTRANDGVYWCNATNELFVVFEAMSLTTSVTVFYPPIVDLIETSEQITRDQSQFVTFKCRATGIPPPTIQWTGSQQSQPISNRDGKYTIVNDVVLETQGVGPHNVVSEIIILNLTVSDDQTYTCTGNNTINSMMNIDNASVTLNILAEPFVIPLTSSPMLVFHGHTLTISFSIRGDHPSVDPDTGIVWRFRSSSDSIELEEDDRYRFEDNNERLVIDSVGLEDAGTYSLTASNQGGSHTSSVIINVAVLPVIRESSNTISRRLGDSVTLNCTVDALPSPSIIWRRNGTIISNTNPRWELSTYSVASVIEGATGAVSTLTLLEMRISDDSSRVECTGTNDYGEISVQYVLELEDIPDPCEGITCQNEGTCYADATGSSYVCICSEDFTGRFCEIAVPPSAIVTPTITRPPMPFRGSLYSPVNLTCNAQGNPTPVITWYKDGSLIPDQRQNSYYIPELLPSLRGHYHCVANNSGGSVQSDQVLVSITNVAQYIVSFSTGDSMSLLAKLRNETDSITGNLTYFDFETRDGSGSSVSVDVLVTIVINNDDVRTDDLLQQSILNSLNSITNSSYTATNITRFDGCDSELTSFSLNVYWPETYLGSIVSRECPCGALSLGMGHPVSTRACTGSFTTGAQWSVPDSSCEFSQEVERLCQLPPTTLSSIQTLESITNDASPQLIDDTQLLVSLVLLEGNLESIATNTTYTESAFNTIDNLLQANESVWRSSQISGNVTARLLILVDEIVSLLPVRDGRVVEYLRESFSVQTQRTFDNGTGNETVTFMPAQSNSIGVNISSSAGPINIGFSHYATSVLFQSDDAQSVSPVIGATLNTGSTTNILNFVVIQLESDSNERMNDIVCSFWDFTLNDNYGGWSEEGCEKVSTNNTVVLCQCNHLTHFALTLPASDMSLSDSTCEENSVLDIIEVISVIAMAISIVLMIVALLTHLLPRKLRSTTSSRLFINLCLSLIALYGAYIGAVYGRYNSTACVLFATLFQYGLYAVLMSMLVNAGYLILVMWTPKPSHRYAIVTPLVTWILPAIIVGFLIAPLHSYYGSDSCRFCYPSDLLFYITLVAPLALIVIMECIIYIVTLAILSKNILSKTSDERTHLLTSIAFTVIFTVGWSVGLAKLQATGSAAVVLEAVFAATGGLLGVYTILVFCVAVARVRNTWKQCFYKVTCANYEEEEEEDSASLGQGGTKAADEVFESKRPVPQLSLNEFKYVSHEELLKSPTYSVSKDDGCTMHENGNFSMTSPSISPDNIADSRGVDKTDQPVAPVVRTPTPKYGSDFDSYYNIDPPDPSEETQL